MENISRKYGFTLLELMVVVIIIAVLAAIAVPMYKHAVLKSRFSTVMPMAKAVADAQEVYYLGKNMYALSKEDLDIAPVEAEKAQVTLSSAEEEEKYIYVAANRTDIPNVRYIVYQKNSPKFASNVHCEADANDSEALWLCEKGLQGTEVTGSLQGKNYKTFLLAGDLGGSSFKVCPDNAQCDEEGNVTGCESGYYQEEQSCKQEKACDEASKTIRTACAENCGEEVKEGTCNVKTGQWENYTVTQECPVKPTTEEPCEEGSDTKKTRSVSCNPTTEQWVVQGDWDTSKCKKECDPDKKPKTSQTCDAYKETTDQWCGTVTQNVECDDTTGEWKVSNVQESCTTADYNVGDTQSCGSRYCSGNKTLRGVSCNASNGTWNYDWNTSSCKTTGSERTYYSSCHSYSYSYVSGSVYKTRSCSNGTWGSYSYDTSGCTQGCYGSAPTNFVYVATSQCSSGYGKKIYSYTCQGSTWKKTDSFTINCVTTAKEICYASLDVGCYNTAYYGYREGGAIAASRYYDASTGECSSAGCVESIEWDEEE